MDSQTVDLQFFSAQKLLDSANVDVIFFFVFSKLSSRLEGNCNFVEFHGKLKSVNTAFIFAYFAAVYLHVSAWNVKHPELEHEKTT